MKTLLLDRSDVAANAQMDEVIPAVEAAFAAYDRDEVIMPPKSYVELEKYNGDFRSMPAYMDAGSWDAAVVKWVNVHPDNPSKHQMPTVMGTVIYSNPETAFPLAILDGTELTRQRTGAAAAVATDHLAIEEAHTLGIIGAGEQSFAQVEAIAAVRPIEQIVVHDINDNTLELFVNRFSDQFDVTVGSIRDAARCDVLATVTPVRDPIVHPEDLGSHTHVNAMGADAAGKQELATEILQSAKLVIDDYEQCTHSGEINVPWTAGEIDDNSLYGELGAIVTGRQAGRTVDDGVTVFDSTGLAIQDVAAAHCVYERAQAEGEGTPFDLLELDRDPSTPETAAL